MVRRSKRDQRFARVEVVVKQLFLSVGQLHESRKPDDTIRLLELLKTGNVMTSALIFKRRG